MEVNLKFCKVLQDVQTHLINRNRKGINRLTAEINIETITEYK